MSYVTATIIGVGGSAAIQAYGAHKASKAAKEAAATQSASADQALALQKQMYDQTRQDLAPYRETGNTALSSLSSFLGLPANTPSPTVPAATPPAGLAPQAGAPPSHQLPQLQTPVGGQPYGPGHGYVAAPPSQPGSVLVMLRAPNGQTKQVPADQVDYYVSRGATKV
jgi:hypothetical protein